MTKKDQHNNDNNNKKQLALKTSSEPEASPFYLLDAKFTICPMQHVIQLLFLGFQAA